MTVDEFIVKNIIGIDYEPEDRDVGIFGNTFSIGFETDKGEQKWAVLFDDQLMSLFKQLKNYFRDEIEENPNVRLSM